jgi:hypothetical protein
LLWKIRLLNILKIPPKIGKIANIVWTDAKMIAAYVRFGDVVVFDTTFDTNNEKWVFGVFVGFNHFREIVTFWCGSHV